MFGFTLTRRHRAELLAAHAETTRMREERDNALSERDAFKASAKAAARIVAETDERQRQALAVVTGEALVEGGRTGRQTPLLVDLIRTRDRARTLEARLAELQAINERCTCGGSG
jgi:hypothetical protein